MFAQKDDLPVPKEEQLRVLKEEMEKRNREIELEERKKKIHQPPPPPRPRVVVEEEPIPEFRESEHDRTGSMLQELYQIMSNRFDQIYYKIDQTQDMILKLEKDIKNQDKN